MSAMSKSKVIIFTDGSSRGNPCPGGWGAVITGGNNVTELGGGEKSTTNNRMELTAAVEALKKSPKGPDIVLYTDSSYIIKGITKWIHSWKENGWRTKAKKDVLNKDLWVELDKSIGDIELSGGKIDWKYVGGHIGIAGNERCDEIATAFADDKEVKLYNGLLASYDLPNILDVAHDESRLAVKKSGSAHSRAKAYSYVSKVGGIIKIDKTWAECEKRVKGVPGALFKKSLNAADELAVVADFKSR